jgi:hypothetical protein
MKIRNLLFGVVLATMVVFPDSSTTNTIKADGCENCVILYNACEASCNGDRGCIKDCQRDYTECACQCGFQCGGPIQ